LSLQVACKKQLPGRHLMPIHWTF